jgi:hypothetical protein
MTASTTKAPVKSGDKRPTTDRLRRVLVIGTVTDAFARGHTGQVIHAPLSFLSRSLLDLVRPDCIVAPLISPNWDVLDLAEALTALSYTGPLVVQSEPLPRADLVLGELQDLFPGLSMAFVEQHG